MSGHILRLCVRRRWLCGGFVGGKILEDGIIEGEIDEVVVVVVVGARRSEEGAGRGDRCARRRVERRGREDIMGRRRLVGYDGLISGMALDIFQW